MAIVMVALMLPVGVLAVDGSTGTAFTLYLGSDDNKSVDLSGNSALSAEVSDWSTSNSSVATVSNGVVSAAAVGTAMIRANYANNTSTAFSITVSKWEIKGITIEPKDSTKTYFAGDKLSQSDFTVTATYNDGDTKELTSSEYTLSPSGELSATDTKATAALVSNTEITNDCNITVKTPTVKSVSVKLSKYSFTAGEGLPTITATVTFTDNSTVTTTSNFTIYLCSGSEETEISTSYKFTTADTGKTIKVSYQGVKSSASNGITVTEEAPDSTDEYTFSYTGTPKVMTYTVGQQFDPTGISVSYKKAGSSYGTSGATYKVSSTTTFTSTTETTATVVLLVNVGSDTWKEYSITFTGIKVTAAATLLDPYSITSVVMDEDEYSVGHKFDLDDINYIYYKASASDTKTKLYASEFANYSDTITLEVRKANGGAKSSNKTTIEEANIITDEDDDDRQYVILRLTIGDKYINFEADVTEPKVSYYYDDDLIATYDSFVTALKYTEDQDSDVEDDFDIDDVDDDEYILLVLGDDASVSSTTKLNVEHNIVIDLNGHDLTFRSGTIKSFEDEDYTVIIKNSSEKEATFTYYDKNIEITLGEGDSFKFEEGYDEESVLPGVIEIELEVGTGGTVTGSPKASNNVITVGMGTEVKLTITPSTGYAISDVKLGTKSVIKTTAYKTTTSGATYTFNPKESAEVKVTFVETASTWKNPFKDVSSSSSYYSAVEFVYTNELFQGVSSTEFKPNSTMTRAMFATVLARLADVDVSRYKTSSFTDVSYSDTRLTTEMVQSVEWAYQEGIIEGYGDGTFGPHNEIRHQQMYLMMYRYTMFIEKLTAKTANLSSVSLTVSDKNDVADWALTGVKFAQKNGILITSSSNRITPADDALRHELAQLLEKYCINVLGWAE